jgi:hypothetical protein
MCHRRQTAKQEVPMEKYKGTENFGPSPNAFDFDFDIDLRLNASDYLRMIPWVLFLLPPILVLELFSKFSKNGAANTEQNVDKIDSLQPVQARTRVG